MRAALDTSVLVAGMVAAHPAHRRCVSWLRRGHRGEVELLVASHSLAETYAAKVNLLEEAHAGRWLIAWGHDGTQPLSRIEKKGDRFIAVPATV